jgi:hypothetical protein
MLQPSRKELVHCISVETISGKIGFVKLLQLIITEFLLSVRGRRKVHTRNSSQYSDRIHILCVPISVTHKIRNVQSFLRLISTVAFFVRTYTHVKL